jgi:hypothetical protein
LGFFSLPSAWFCHLLLVALIPLVDLMLIVSLFVGQGTMLIVYAGIFLFIDLFLATAACIMEGEPKRKAWYILPMRLFYRPLLAWAIWTAILRSLRGAWVGWGKQERKGSVRALFGERDGIEVRDCGFKERLYIQNVK